MYTSLRTLCNYVFIFSDLTDSRGWTSNDLWLHSAFFPFNERTKDNYSLLMDKRTVIYIKKKKIISILFKASEGKHSMCRCILFYGQTWFLFFL